MNMFDRDYEELGSSDKGLILKNSGKVKIQFGKKLVDLLDKTGTISRQVSGPIIKKVDSIENIKHEGLYYIDNKLYFKVGDSTLEIAVISDNTIYVSFLLEQEVTSELKQIALQNIGLIYPNLNPTNIFPTNGLIFTTNDLQLYIVKDGKLTNYLNPYTKQIVIDTNDKGALIIKGATENNGIIFDNLKIYSNSNNTAVLEANNKFLLKTNNKEVVIITPDLVTLENARVEDIETDRIHSFGAHRDKGFRISKEEGLYVLDIDRIRVRYPIERNTRAETNDDENSEENNNSENNNDSENNNNSENNDSENNNLNNNSNALINFLTTYLPTEEGYLHYNNNVYNWQMPSGSNLDLFDTLMLLCLNKSVIVKYNDNTINTVEIRANQTNASFKVESELVCNISYRGTSGVLSKNKIIGNNNFNFDFENFNYTLEDKSVLIQVADIFNSRIKELYSSDISLINAHSKVIMLTLKARKELSIQGSIPTLDWNTLSLNIVLNSSFIHETILNGDFCTVSNILFDNSSETITLEVSVEQNTTGNTRSCIITIWALGSEQPLDIEITQAGLP